jgi:tRNA pseudouridine38-40 synthase
VERRRYALRLLYDGRCFRGFQRQPGLPSVQASLEEALQAAIGARPALQVAGRTDAGVSALAQVVSFSSRGTFDPAELRRRVNAALPEGLLCTGAAQVSASFHARASASGRRYVYLIGTPPPPEVSPWCWTLPDERAFPGLGPRPLDASAMRAALAHAVGTHDFAGFARPGEQVGSVRTVTRADVVEADAGGLFALVLEGRGFLRAMVRNLAGTAVAAGFGLIPPERLGELLLRPERYRGVRAPGWGLTLVSVSYPGDGPDWG